MMEGSHIANGRYQHNMRVITWNIYISIAYGVS